MDYDYTIRRDVRKRGTHTTIAGGGD
jgi:hypothetical protein